MLKEIQNKKQLRDLFEGHVGLRALANVHHTVGPGSSIVPIPKLEIPKPNPLPNMGSHHGTARYAFASGVGLICANYGQNINELEATRALGTCVLVSKSWILTARHALPSLEFAQNFFVVFGYQLSGPVFNLDFSGAYPYTLSTPKELFENAIKIGFDYDETSYFSSADGLNTSNGHQFHLGDWALIKLKKPVDPKFSPIPATTIPSNHSVANSPIIEVPFYQGILNEKNDLIPDGAPLPLHKIAVKAQPSVLINRIKNIQNNGMLVEHTAPAYRGASGAPLLNETGSFVGIHVRSPSLLNINYATSATFIANSLRSQKFPDLDSTTLKDAIDPP